MTFAPPTLNALAAYWVSQGGVDLGIVGDHAHLDRGVSYHLGADQLLPGAYSAERPRDKAGLTNAASAIDLGKLNGGYPQLRAFSDWLARLCVKNQPGTRDIVEVIYSPDGKRVLGFKDGVDFLIPNYGDASHLYHTHISYYRDSEHRTKVPLFEEYFLPDSSTEVSMRFRITEVVAGSATVTVAGAQLVTIDGRRIAIPKGQVREVTAGIALLEPLDTAPGDRTNAWLVGRALSPVTEPANSEATFLLKAAASAHVVKVEAVA